LINNKKELKTNYRAGCPEMIGQQCVCLYLNICGLLKSQNSKTKIQIKLKKLNPNFQKCVKLPIMEELKFLF